MRLPRIVQPVDALAKECVRLLLKQINGKIYKKRRILLDVELREGESN